MNIMWYYLAYLGMVPFKVCIAGRGEGFLSVCNFWTYMYMILTYYYDIATNK